MHGYPCLENYSYASTTLSLLLAPYLFVPVAGLYIDLRGGSGINLTIVIISLSIVIVVIIVITIVRCYCCYYHCCYCYCYSTSQVGVAAWLGFVASTWQTSPGGHGTVRAQLGALK